MDAGKPLDEELSKQCRGWLEFSRQGRAYVAGLLEQAERALPQVPEERKNFYQGHLLTQLRVHLESLAMLEAYCRLLLAHATGDKPQSLAQARQALHAANELFAALRKAEYGKWSRWYIGERFVGLDDLTIGGQRLVRLGGEPVPPLRHRLTYEDSYRYQEPFLQNFPLLYPKK